MVLSFAANGVTASIIRHSTSVVQPPAAKSMGMHAAFVSVSAQLPFSATPPRKIIGSQVGLFLIVANC
jgi:hypothetical protein